MKYASIRKSPSQIHMKFGIYASLFSLSMLMAGCSSDDKTTTPKDQSTQVIEMIPADLVSVQAGRLEKVIHFTGSIRPLVQSNVQAQVSAQALQVHGLVGNYVTKDQVLVVLNKQDQTSRLAQAEANVNAARAQVELSRSLMERKKRLYDQGFISKVEYEQSQVDYKAQLGNLNAQEANVAISQKATQDSNVISPISGYITSRQIEPGQTVSPGQTLFQIVDTSQLELQGAISADHQQSLSIGQVVHYQLQGMNQSLQARIVRIAPTANSANRQVEFFAQPLSSLSSIAIGAYVRGEIREAQQQKGVLIPLNTIQSIEQDPYVWAVSEQTLVKRPIQLLDQNYAGNMALVDGLLPKDQVSRVTFADRDHNKTVKVTSK